MPGEQRNVLGGELQVCGADPLTGFYRDGRCQTSAEDPGSHTICTVVSREFLEHQRSVGNDLITPRTEYGFPGLQPGDRWCVVAARWLQACQAGAPAPVLLAATHESALEVVPLQLLRSYAADIPDDPSSLF